MTLARFRHGKLPFHYCLILQKYDTLSFKNVKIFKFACPVYKSLYDLAPHTLCEFITFKSNISRRVTTASNTLSILIKKQSKAYLR